MNIYPNESTLMALVKHIVPCADGYGYDLELKIINNESPVPDNDYLKHQAGEHLKVFAADLGAMQTGWHIRAKVSLSGGPFGQRAVLRSAEQIDIKSSP